MKLCEIAAKLYFFLLISVSLHNFHFNFLGLKHGTVNMYGSSFSSLVSGHSGAKGLIKFKQVVFAHTLDNQMVSNSVFKVTRIIYIVRLSCKQRYYECKQSTALTHERIHKWETIHSGCKDSLYQYVGPQSRTNNILFL